jgi:hypothetical protein
MLKRNFAIHKKLGVFHFSLLTHPVGAIPPWLPRNLGDRSKMKCSQKTSFIVTHLWVKAINKGALLSLFAVLY